MLEPRKEIGPGQGKTSLHSSIVVVDCYLTIYLHRWSKLKIELRWGDLGFTIKIRNVRCIVMFGTCLILHIG